MIGYHGAYEYLGKVAARLDDLRSTSFPARLTALLLVVACPLRRRERAGRLAVDASAIQVTPKAPTRAGR